MVRFSETERARIEELWRSGMTCRAIARELSFPDRPELWVSHETIYQSLYVQARGALRKELTAHLRRRHASRRPRGHSIHNGQGQLRGVLHISERPPEALPRRPRSTATWVASLGTGIPARIYGRRVRAGACSLYRAAPSLDAASV